MPPKRMTMDEVYGDLHETSDELLTCLQRMEDLRDRLKSSLEDVEGKIDVLKSCINDFGTW